MVFFILFHQSACTHFFSVIQQKTQLARGWANTCISEKVFQNQGSKPITVVSFLAASKKLKHMSIIFICYSQKQPDDSRLLSRCENVTRSFRIQCLFQLLSSTSKCLLCKEGILFVSMYKTIEINYFQVRNNTVINLVNQTEGGNHNFLSQRVTLTGNQKLAWHAFRFPLRYLC